MEKDRVTGETKVLSSTTLLPQNHCLQGVKVYEDELKGTAPSRTARRRQDQRAGDEGAAAQASQRAPGIGRAGAAPGHARRADASLAPVPCPAWDPSWRLGAGSPHGPALLRTPRPCAAGERGRGSAASKSPCPAGGGHGTGAMSARRAPAGRGECGHRARSRRSDRDRSPPAAPASGNLQEPAPKDLVTPGGRQCPWPGLVAELGRVTGDCGG